MIDVKAVFSRILKTKNKKDEKSLSPPVMYKISVLIGLSEKLPSKLEHIQKGLFDLANICSILKIPAGEEACILEASLERKIMMITFCLNNCISGIVSGEINRHLSDAKQLLELLQQKLE